MEKIIYYVDGEKVSLEEFREKYDRRVEDYGDLFVKTDMEISGDTIYLYL